MKPIMLLPVLLCAAFAAPTEEELKPLETIEVVQNDETHGAEVPAPRYNFCPNGWFSYGTRCFMFVNSPMTWYKAEEHCNNLGGHLTSVTNPQEYSFLQQITPVGQTIAWLGGFNLQGEWMWIDRKGFYYTNWFSQSTTSSNPCLYLNSNSGWRNTACSTSYCFICSKNAFGC